MISDSPNDSNYNTNSNYNNNTTNNTNGNSNGTTTSTALRTILLPVKDKELMRQGSVLAVEWTLSSFTRPGDKLHVMSIVSGTPTPEVVRSISLDGGPDNFQVTEDPGVNQQKIDAARKMILAKFAPLVEAAADVAFEFEIVHASSGSTSIGELVCKRATDLDAAAVVVCKKKVGALSEFFLGSVAKYLAAHCPKPVITLHSDGTPGR